MNAAGLLQRLPMTAVSGQKRILPVAASAARRSFASEVTPVRVPLRARLRSFFLGFGTATVLASYIIIVRVQWQAEELNSIVREAASKQAHLERKLAALEER
mmetsp:Transcript_17427/g.31417  ORF Transcript_17427/g.31417 Transcript_17427/m.31417 type:complete len:102 (+) Transcript_17427:75-380(+)